VKGERPEEGVKEGRACLADSMGGVEGYTVIQRRTVHMRQARGKRRRDFSTWLDPSHGAGHGMGYV